MVDPIFPARLSRSRVLVVTPTTTVDNWEAEFRKWTAGLQNQVRVYTLTSETKGVDKRAKRLKRWFEKGGVLIIGYELFQRLSKPEQKETMKQLLQGL
jgi:SNF2 family DNA or RNA helicase